MKWLSLCFLIAIISVSLQADSKVVKVVTENWKPYNYVENGIIRGTSTELVRKVLDHAGVEYSINVYPWARSYNLALNNKNTLIYTIVRMPLREGLFQWIGPVAAADTVALFRLKSRSDIVINSLDDARQYTIGVVREDMKHHYLLTQNFTEDDGLSLTTKQTQNVQKLLAGRVDLIAFSSHNIVSEMKMMNISEDMIEKAFILFKSYPYMALSKQTSQSLFQKILSSYMQLQQEGRIDHF